LDLAVKVANNNPQKLLFKILYIQVYKKLATNKMLDSI
jgi:hypothetical protein